MSTIHIDAKKEDVKKIVLMPGDPLRAKYIAENFLEDAYQINHTRGMLAYTGKYLGKDVTVFASGMGCPSMGIYAYELYKFYEVDVIVRIGTCGAISKELNLLDIIIADSSCDFSNLPELLFQDSSFEFFATNAINNKLEKLAKERNFSYKRGKVATVDAFDAYVKDKKFLKTLYERSGNPLATEMESSALFAIAKHLNKSAACLLSVTDSPFKKEEISSEMRESALGDMISLALDMTHNL